MYLRTQSVQRQSRFRFTLGMAQMFGAVVSLTLLIETGVTAFTLASVLGTGILTGLSLFLYRRQ
jgi:plastocyanin domain-containing protein